MTDTKHTSGKWEIVEDDFGDGSELMLPGQIVATDKKKIIALVGGHLTDYDEPYPGHEGHYQRHERYVEMSANARLISKAPELLGVLEYILGRLSEPPLACRSPEERLEELLGWINEEILPACERVIAEAKGKTT